MHGGVHNDERPPIHVGSRAVHTCVLRRAKRGGYVRELEGDDLATAVGAAVAAGVVRSLGCLTLRAGVRRRDRQSRLSGAATIAAALAGLALGDGHSGRS